MNKRIPNQALDYEKILGSGEPGKGHSFRGSEEREGFSFVAILHQILQPNGHERAGGMMEPV